MIFDNVRCQVRNCMKHTPHVCISLIFSNVSDAQSLVFCVMLLSAIVFFFVLFFAIVLYVPSSNYTCWLRLLYL